MYNVFGRKNCTWCDRTLELLNDEHIDYEYFDIEEERSNYDLLRSYFPFTKTVPQIVLMTPDDGDHEFKRIGGYTELVEWLKSRERSK